MPGRTSRKTQVARRFLQLRRVLNNDIQRLRHETIARLDELFGFASLLASGQAQFTYCDGKRERVTIGQRKKWLKVATCIAQFMSMVAEGIDERQINMSLQELEKLLNEAGVDTKIQETKKGA